MFCLLIFSLLYKLVFIGAYSIRPVFMEQRYVMEKSQLFLCNRRVKDE